MARGQVREQVVSVTQMDALVESIRELQSRKTVIMCREEDHDRIANVLEDEGVSQFYEIVSSTFVPFGKMFIMPVSEFLSRMGAEE